MNSSPSNSQILEELRQTDWDEFEQLVAEHWEERGWNARVTSGSRDRGIDIEATKHNPAKSKLLIQAKRHQQGNKISAPKIQQYAGLYIQENNVDTVYVVTTSSFTRQAKETADDSQVKLINGQKLVRSLSDQLIAEWFGDTANSTTNNNSEKTQSRKSEIRISDSKSGPPEYINNSFSNSQVLKELQQMDWNEFEALIIENWEEYGWNNTRVTSESQDRGIDINAIEITKKHNSLNYMIIREISIVYYYITPHWFTQQLREGVYDNWLEEQNLERSFSGQQAKLINGRKLARSLSNQLITELFGDTANLSNSQIVEELRQMDWDEFVALVVENWQEHGWNNTRVPSESRDYPLDIERNVNFAEGKGIVIREDIVDSYAITTHSFSQQSKESADDNQMKLINGQKLVRSLSDQLVAELFGDTANLSNSTNNDSKKTQSRVRTSDSNANSPLFYNTGSDSESGPPEYVNNSSSNSQILEELRQMNWNAFEALVVEHCEGHGWNTRVTSRKQNSGIDIEATKHNPTKSKLLIRAKRNRHHNEVSTPRTQRYVSSYRQGNNVDAVYAVARYSFTQEGKEMVDDTQLKLINGQKLIRSLSDQLITEWFGDTANFSNSTNNDSKGT